MSLYKMWPSWPPALSLSGWNSKKGVIAKVVKGETGIGAKITEAHGAYDKIKAGYFSEISVDTSTKAGTVMPRG